MNTKDKSIRRVQETALNLLHQALKIIQDNNLRYYVLGGTLLGAVRHNGFIPWDDDIDIGLPRPDYDLFIKFAEEQLKEPYSIHTIESCNKEYAYYYARLEDDRVRLVREATIAQLTIPAFIDIFPLDGVPEEGRARDGWIRHGRMLKKLFTISQYRYLAARKDTSKHRSVYVEVLRCLVLFFKIDSLLNTQRIWKRLDKHLRLYSYDDSDYIINFCGFWGLKELFPKTVYGDGALYQFEDIKVVGPQNYDYVLRQMYGDYMTPPPLDKRNHHHLRVVLD